MRRLFTAGPPLAIPLASHEAGLNSPDPSTDGEVKKTWFGAAATGLLAGGAALARTRSGTVSPLPATDGLARTASASDRTGAVAAIAEDDESEGAALPFSSSRLQSPSTNPGSSPHGSAPLALDGRSSYGAGTGVNSSVVGGEDIRMSQKDAMMVDLLSGEAVMESKDYDILDWDEMAQIKKSHAVLATRISALSRSVALETRLRDSTAKLVQSSLSDTPASPARSTSSPRQRVSREQAESQLAVANDRLARVSSELHRIGWTESELRTKLLKHTAGVLALALRRKEDEELGVPPTPLSPHAGTHETPRTSLTALDRKNGRPLHSTPSRPNDVRFEGAHFFAGHNNAIIPLARSSPYASPSLGSAPTHFAALPVDTSHYEEEIAQLKMELAEARQSSEGTMAQLRSDGETSRNGLDESRSLVDGLRRELADSQRTISSLREDVDASLAELREGKGSADATRQEMLELQRELHDGRREVQLARTGSSDHHRLITDARQEQDELSRQLDLAHGRHGELELELAGEREQNAVEMRRLQGSMQELEARTEDEKSRGSDGERRARKELSDMVDERRKLTQSIGDVLRRHRTRPVLGPAIRDLPSFDDTSDRADYLTATLESHFDKIAEHVTTQDRSLASVKAIGLESTNGHQKELQQARLERDGIRDQLGVAVQSRESIEADLQRLQMTHQDLSTEHDALKSRSVGNEDKDIALAKVQRELDAARSESAQFGIEWSALSKRTTSLEEELLEAKKQHSRMTTNLQTLEVESTTHKQAAERAQKVLDDRNGDLGTYQQSIKDLEERAEVSANQEVAMLERLNEFTVRLEQTRTEKRKLDMTSQAQIKLLEEDKTTLNRTLGTLEADLAKARSELTAASNRPDDSASVKRLEDELQEMKHAQTDLEEELADANKREAATRVRLSDELNQVQLELTSVKTQLRVEKRKAVAK